MGKNDPKERIEAFKKKDKLNGQCAVCGAHTTTVLMQHLSFVCTRCSGLLREAGLSVKGIGMTNWTAADADKICAGGNKKEADDLLGRWDGNELAVHRDSDDNSVRKFIAAKYTEKRWAGGGGGGRGGGGGGEGRERKSSSKNDRARSWSGGGGSGGGTTGKDAAKSMAAMFHDLNEAKAAELIAKHGSVEEAVEAYLSGDVEKSIPSSKASGRKSGKEEKESNKSSKKSSIRDSGSNNSGDFGDSGFHGGGFHGGDSGCFSFGHNGSCCGCGCGGGTFNSAPPMSTFRTMDGGPPPPLGQAPPSQAHAMAGMVGLAARGEIASPGGCFGSASGCSCAGGMPYASNFGSTTPPGPGHIIPTQSHCGAPTQQELQLHQQQQILLHQLLEKKRQLTEQLQRLIQQQQQQVQHGYPPPQGYANGPMGTPPPASQNQCLHQPQRGAPSYGPCTSQLVSPYGCGVVTGNPFG